MYYGVYAYTSMFCCLGVLVCLFFGGVMLFFCGLLEVSLFLILGALYYAPFMNLILVMSVVTRCFVLCWLC